MQTFSERIYDILACAPVGSNRGEIIGNSRSGLPIEAFRFGRGIENISLIGGCHADEPVGPRFLRHFVAYLRSLPDGDPILTRYTWWIVPHTNPDGEVTNRAWYDGNEKRFDYERYLQHVKREGPGDDIEFGFPRNEDDMMARPENRAIDAWWRSGETEFAMHASLHGLAVGAGPWFLLEKEWWPRCDRLRRFCTENVNRLGYILHDVDRGGEKGFYRLAEGFCSRPDSREMRDYFLQAGVPVTAEKFRPSSMETIRAFGGDPLTLVSEMPLFIIPKELSGPEKMKEWKHKIHEWRKTENRKSPGWAKDLNLEPMPVTDQMTLQWTFISAGLDVMSSSV